MGTYILRRLLIALPLLLLISVITFGFINLAPGDPVTAMMDPAEGLQADDLRHMRERLGLNRPVHVRYALWLREFATGNFGYSYENGRPVIERIRSRVLPTLELTATALLISTVLGVTFGVIAAVRQYGVFDYVLSTASLFGVSIPTFFFALAALYVFAAVLEILPAFGMTDETQGFSITDNLHHLILPAGVLSIDSMAVKTRYARTAMLEVLKSDYMTTARAKGLPNSLVIARHAFRNALLPIITILTLQLPNLIGGAIIIESMFSWPGMGHLSFRAVQARDYPTLMALTMIISSLVLLANLLADVLYAYADPRIRVTARVN